MECVSAEHEVNDTVPPNTSISASETACTNSTGDTVPIVSQDGCSSKEPSRMGVQSLHVVCVNRHT